MITIDEMESMLDEITSEIPPEIYKDLNGGIILLPEVKYNNISTRNDLYIMGEYHRGGHMGRYISIYYGSFIQIYGFLGEEAMKERLRHTLKHELTHHLESLAGELGLEVKEGLTLISETVL